MPPLSHTTRPFATLPQHTAKVLATSSAHGSAVQTYYFAGPGAATRFARLTDLTRPIAGTASSLAERDLTIGKLYVACPTASLGLGSVGDGGLVCT